MALCGLLLTAYAESITAPFVLDDRTNILDNPTIRSLWPLPWYGPWGQVTAGRPVANLSFALSYSLSGLLPWGYHAINIAIHVTSMLLLYGIVRRTLTLPLFAGRYDGHAQALAFFSAFIWGLHPLNTQAVTYISQRFESMAAAFMLAALYCAVRGWEKERGRWWWRAASVGAMFLSMGTKETAAAGPLVIFLYESMLVRRNFRGALANSWPLYVGFAFSLTWLAYLLGLGGTAVTIDFTRFTPWQYLVTQTRVICHYLRLAIFPYPLLMDYDWPRERFSTAWPYALLLGSLLAATLWGIFKKWPVALAGAFFFATISISSSFFPLMDAAFEYRMYLPLAPLCVVAGAGAFRLTVNRGKGLFAFAMGIATAGLLLGTAARNRDYLNEVTLWADTVTKRPQNTRALLNLGYALAKSGDCARAQIFYKRVLSLTPDAWDAWYNLGNCLMMFRDLEGARECYQRSLALHPVNTAAHVNLALTFQLLNKPAEAIRQLKLALVDDPNNKAARKALAELIAKLPSCSAASIPTARGGFEEIRP